MDSDRDVWPAGRFDKASERGAIDATLLEAALGALRNPLAYLLPVPGPSGRAVDFRLSWANPAYVVRFAPHDDAIGRPVSQVFPPAFRESLLGAYLDAFEQQQQLSVERIFEINGRPCDFLFTLLPTDAGLAVSVDDRTKRKRAESELALTTSILRGITRLQERFLAGERLRDVFTAAADLAIEVTGSTRGFIGEAVPGDPDRLRLHAVQGVEWSDEERAAQSEIVDRGGRIDRLEALWRRVQREDNIVVVNDAPTQGTMSPDDAARVRGFLGVPIRRHNKLLGIIGVANRPGGYDDGWAVRLEPLVAAAGALVDAGNQMAERERVEGELRRSEELLREAQEIAAIGAYSYGQPDGPVRWSRQMYALFSVSPDREPLSLRECFGLCGDESRHALHELFQCVLGDGQQRDLDATFLIEDKTRHLQLVVRGRLGDDGRVVEVSGTVKDITERKQVEEARIRFEQQIAETQRLEALGLLAGGIAHDVNNLLVGVLANAQLIHCDVADGELKEAAGEIETAARRMAELTRQILDYAGRSRAAPQPLDLNPLTSETVQLVRRTLAKSAKVDLSLSDEIITVVADAAQLRQVVMNLVINAGEALSGSRGEVTVRTRIERSPEGPSRALLTVSDTGVGMSDEVRRRIFDPFFTTKTKGRGLGLSAVHGIVRRFGGTIEVESVPLRGTTFKVALPLSSSMVTPIFGVRGVVSRTRPLRVLVVDDEAVVRKAVQRMLERMSCTVLVADGGREALNAFASMQDRIDVVLLDVLMPYLSGADVLREIRRIAPRQRVVMMSGFVGQDEQATTNADGFLKKPFTSEELEALLATMAEKRAE